MCHHCNYNLHLGNALRLHFTQFEYSLFYNIVKSSEMTSEIINQLMYNDV
jgi:hypothetical protein